MAKDTERIVELAITQSQARLAQSFSDFDALDAKSLGVLAADAAALGVVIATHDSLSQFWWVPGVAFAVAGLILLWSVRPQEYDLGPDIRGFFSAFGGLSYEDAALQMFGELLAAVEHNEREVNPRKARSFKIGFVIFVAGLIGAFLVGLFR